MDEIMLIATRVRAVDVRTTNGQIFEAESVG